VPKPLVRVAQPGDIDEVVKLCAEHALFERRSSRPKAKRTACTAPSLVVFPVFGVSWPKLAVQSLGTPLVLRIIRLGGQPTTCIWTAYTLTRRTATVALGLK